MTNTLKINHINHTIVMDRTFARNATDTRSEEYTHLQQVRRDYPGYQVVQRRIRTNSNKKTYKGLTYEYMEDYILTHGSEENRKANFKEYTEKRIIAECHGKAFRYPVIKSWFLEKYPEIASFGMEEAVQVIEYGNSAAKASAAAPSSEQDNESSGGTIALLEAAKIVQEAAA